MARNTTAQQFRDAANDETWVQMVQDYESLSPEEFKNKYDFTFSAVRKDAVEKGFYQQKRNASVAKNEVKNAAARPFMVRDCSEKISKVTRSVQINEDIYMRLKSLESDKGQYTHAAILNQLLEDALEIYGY